MNVNVINPLEDSRWNDLVSKHRHASIFHERGWIEALARTYGYKPVVLTSASKDVPMKDGIVLCRVSSWITGTRLVSLPFSDHCEPLFSEQDEAPDFRRWIRDSCDHKNYKYVELRPLLEPDKVCNGLQPGGSYCFHELDLSPSLEQIFGKMHHNSFRRKIHKAEREKLSYEAGNSDRVIDEFYRLVLLTRRRHKLLPQPRAWFRSLCECLGEKVQIRLAKKNGYAIAAMLTLRHGTSAVFKYGGSDARFHSLGGVPFLFWKFIEESKASGAEKIDLGRTDWDNNGLVTFKDRLGSTRRLLTYYRYSNRKEENILSKWTPSRDWRAVFSLPDTVLSTAGRLLYRHMG